MCHVIYLLLPLFLLRFPVPDGTWSFRMPLMLKFSEVCLCIRCSQGRSIQQAAKQNDHYVTRISHIFSTKCEDTNAEHSSAKYSNAN